MCRQLGSPSLSQLSSAMVMNQDRGEKKVVDFQNKKWNAPKHNSYNGWYLVVAKKGAQQQVLGYRLLGYL